MATLTDASEVPSNFLSLKTHRLPCVIDTQPVSSNQSFAGPFFSLTSNVDAHWLRARHPTQETALFSPVEVYECHGNVETWQCADRMCSAALAGETDNKPPSATLIDGSWPAPPDFMFNVDAETRLAKDELPGHPARRKVCSGQPFDEQAFMSNHPKCVCCNGVAPTPYLGVH